jgi:D-psicose/D-tagatose/L-ribulose 3-epimerase
LSLRFKEDTDMRFGALTVIWTSPFSTERVDLARHIGELGFDVVEVAIEQPGVLDLGELRRVLDETGLRTTVAGAFSPDRDLTSEDPAIQEQGIRYVEHCVNVAAEIGAPVVSGPMYAATGKTELLPDEERQRVFELAAKNIRRAGEYAASKGVNLALEPLNRFETDLVTTTARGVELCENVGLANVGLLLDTFHMNIEEKHIGDALRSAGRHVKHVHASENDRGAPGSGHVAWEEWRDALRDIHYDGVITIESFVQDIKELASAVSMWRPVAASPDELAGDGLKFLKQLFSETHDRQATQGEAHSTV